MTQLEEIEPLLRSVAEKLRGELLRDHRSAALRGPVNVGSWGDRLSVAGFVSCIPSGQPADESIEGVLSVATRDGMLVFTADVGYANGATVAAVLEATLEGNNGGGLASQVERLADQSYNGMKQALARLLFGD